MRQSFLIFTAAAIFAIGTANAQNREDRQSREPIAANQIVARSDARIARIKADLRLTPEQEKHWTGLESALRESARSRADRQVEFEAGRKQKNEPVDFIQFLNSQSTRLGERSAYMKTLAEAAQPLHASLDEQQKRRLAHEIGRLNRD